MLELTWSSSLRERVAATTGFQYLCERRCSADDSANRPREFLELGHTLLEAPLTAGSCLLVSGLRRIPPTIIQAARGFLTGTLSQTQRCHSNVHCKQRHGHRSQRFCWALCTTRQRTRFSSHRQSHTRRKVVGWVQGCPLPKVGGHDRCWWRHVHAKASVCAQPRSGGDQQLLDLLPQRQVVLLQPLRHTSSLSDVHLLKTRSTNTNGKQPNLEAVLKSVADLLPPESQIQTLSRWALNIQAQTGSQPH